jgi:uncharacterized protein (TIGR00369 family)
MSSAHDPTDRQAAPATRSRTYGWSDPQQVMDAQRDVSGLEYLRALHRSGLAAPMSSTLDIQIAHVAEGEAVLEFKPQEWHYNVIGIVHGGMVCTVADTAMAMAALSALPAGFTPTTTDIQIRFYRPISTDTGPVRCRGTVQHLGRRTVAAQAELRDADGRLLAQASTTCLIVPRPS